MASTYNPYTDAKAIYDAKVAWNQATTDEERKRQNEIANAARKNLTAYGYSDVAEQMSASGADATAARKIMEQYAPPPTTAPASLTMSDTELQTTHNNEIRNKTNQLWGTQENDRQTMANKYNKLEDTAYSNPFTTAEAQAILGKYSLAGMNARNNAVASGGASNGGNIDSYAAANAMRQQASIINQGQMAVLDAHNNKINNVKGILEGLGVYQQNQDKGMQNTIGLQQNESQRLFENGETAKNNEVARLSEQASVTGYTPNEWVIKNNDTYNQFLNPDGTFKKEMESVDIQALINAAKTRGDTKTANDLAVVRARKMLGNYAEYGKYMNEGDVSFMTPQQTEAGRQFDKNDATVRETLKTESADNRYAVDAEKSINAGKNATELAIADKKGSTANLDYADIVKMLKQTKTPSQELIDAYNALGIDSTQYTTQNPPSFTGTEVEDGKGDLLGDNGGNTNEMTLEKVKSNISEKKIKNFIDDVLQPYEDNGWEINEDVIEKLLVGSNDGTVVENSNSKIYNIDVEDARKLCNALGLETDWIDDKYTNRTWFNAGKGMKAKEK
jgi:hypothetical protein